MSSNLETLDAVFEYAAEHGGVDGLRVMLAQGSLQGKRKNNVQIFLQHHDAALVASEREQQARQSLSIAERSAVASEKAALAAERSADATDRAATASERSARYAMYAAIISVVTIVVTVVIDLYR